MKLFSVIDMSSGMLAQLGPTNHYKMGCRSVTKKVLLRGTTESQRMGNPCRHMVGAYVGNTEVDGVWRVSQ